jgi:hypothetical protein
MALMPRDWPTWLLIGASILAGLGLGLGTCPLVCGS